MSRRNSTSDLAIQLHNALKGCTGCEWDEAEGDLVDHCAKCQRRVTTLAYELFIGRGTPVIVSDGEGILYD